MSQAAETISIPTNKSIINDEPVLKLFKGIMIPKNDEHVHNATKYFYKIKNEHVNDDFMEVIGRIKQLTHTISDLNLPILLSPEIESFKWDSDFYAYEMVESVDDLVESIKTDIPYGRIAKFISYYQLSKDWLLHGINTGEDVDGTIMDDDIITLGKLAGDIESKIERMKNGSVEHLNHMHKPVNLPSLDKVNDELGDRAEEANLEDHIEELASFEAEHGVQQPVLPKAPNPSGMSTLGIYPTVKRNGQPLPPSKLERALKEKGWFDNKTNLNNISLEILMEEISNRLPSGITITITGK